MGELVYKYEDETGEYGDWKTGSLRVNLVDGQITLWAVTKPPTKEDKTEEGLEFNLAPEVAFKLAQDLAEAVLVQKFAKLENRGRKTND